MLIVLLFNKSIQCVLVLCSLLYYYLNFTEPKCRLADASGCCGGGFIVWWRRCGARRRTKSCGCCGRWRTWRAHSRAGRGCCGSATSCCGRPQSVGAGLAVVGVVHRVGVAAVGMGRVYAVQHLKKYENTCYNKKKILVREKNRFLFKNKELL